MSARIVIDARMLRTTTGRYIDRLLEHLQDLDARNQYLVCLDQRGFDSWFPRAPNFTKVLAPFPAYSWAEQWKFPRLLRRLQADLVHFTMPQQPFLFFGRNVTTVHDLTLIRFSNAADGRWSYRLKMGLFGALLRLIAWRACGVIANSFYTRDDYARLVGCDAEDIHVTHLAADPLAAEPQEIAALKGRRFLLYVGNAYPYKNIDLLLTAQRQLARTDPQLHLVLAGKTDGYHETIERRVREEGIPNVHFPGYVSDGQLSWLYSRAVAYVFPSRSEGFGLPGLEAMLHGLPVISSSSTALPEVFGDAALYFSPDSVEQYIERVQSVLQGRECRDALIRRGHQRVSSYSWSRMAESTLAVYRRCLGQSAHATRPDVV